jgi:hypothetical protein
VVVEPAFAHQLPEKVKEYKEALADPGLSGAVFCAVLVMIK